MLRLAAALALLTALVFPDASHAQDVAYAPGYVVTVDGDTLHGELALLDDIEKARRVTVRSAGDAAPVTYTHREAAAYAYEGGSRFAHRFVYTAPDSSRASHAFLREVVSGPRALYVYHKSADDDLYFIEGEGFPVAGLFEVTEARGQLRRRTRKLWAGTLARAFQACRPLLDDLGDLRYGERDFARITIRYNACVDESYTHTASAQTFRQSSYALHWAVEGNVGGDQLTRSPFLGALDAEDSAGAVFAMRGLAMVELKAWPGRWFGIGEAGVQRHAMPDAAYDHTNVFGRAETVEYSPVFVTVGLGAQYEAPLVPVAPFVRATYVLGWRVAGERNLSRDSEVATMGGVALTGGVAWTPPVGPTLQLGARAEFLDVSNEFIYIPFGSKQGRHRVYGVVLGTRF